MTSSPILTRLGRLLGPDGDLVWPSRTRQATVTAVDAGTRTVTLHLGGDTSDLPGIAYLSGYRPAVGDVVWVDQTGPRLLVLGSQTVGGGAHVGTLSGTTNATGFLTVTHGAGYTPTVVVVQPFSPISGAGALFTAAITDTYTSTTFRLRAMAQNGHSTGDVQSTLITGGYVCHR